MGKAAVNVRSNGWHTYEPHLSSHEGCLVRGTASHQPGQGRAEEELGRAGWWQVEGQQATRAQAGGGGCAVMGRGKGEAVGGGFRRRVRTELSIC